MIERPILFSSEMIKPILEDRKTQTRRVMKPQPVFVQNDGSQMVPYWLWINGKERRAWKSNGDQALIIPACPYGQSGDRLWVKEAWRIPSWYDSMPASKLLQWQRDPEMVWYPADQNDMPELAGRKRSSRYMPRWASRIMLEIVNIRVERLHEISEEEAIAEGIPAASTKTYMDVYPYKEYSEIAPYRNLWDSINAKRGYPWESNPWVWVIEFQRLP